MRLEAHHSSKWLVQVIAISAIALLACPVGASLRGTTRSLNLQNTQARDHDFTFLRTRSQVERFVANGWLVPVRGNQNFRLKGVSFPYARPEVKTFIERLGQQYFAACGEQLVVTSLTRPRNYQPRNASPRSVHPTGMALDLRRSRDKGCRKWLERVLLSLEQKGLLEATYERWPPHYHIAVFPEPYRRYVERIKSGQPTLIYRVSRGDTLWTIARKHHTTVDDVRQYNQLESSKIFPGQILEVPTAE